MRFLLDTCVLSELRKPDCHPKVREAIRSKASEDLFLSVISIGEIAKGVELLDPGRRRSQLKEWLEVLKSSYGSRVLLIDQEISHLWGELSAHAQKRGRKVSVADGLLGATALCHGLRVMTRNVDDFEPTGAQLVNPWL